MSAARLTSWVMLDHSVRLLLEVMMMGRRSYLPATISYSRGPKPGMAGTCRVDSEAPVGLAANGFLAVALRTGRACSHASGSPRMQQVGVRVMRAPHRDDRGRPGHHEFGGNGARRSTAWGCAH